MDSPPDFPHTLLERVNRPPGYQQLLQAAGLALGGGENVLREDWDCCVVLDACRADLFEAALTEGWEPPAEYSYERMRSLDSATEPWVERTVDVGPDAVAPVTYVSSNPMARPARDAAVVETLDEVWQYGWDRDLRTVPPSVVTDRAVHHCRHSEHRVLVHYLQPHMPAIRRPPDASVQGGEPGPGDRGPSERAGSESVERCFEPFGGPEHDGADAWLAKAAGEGSLLGRVLDQWDRPTDDPGGCFEALRFGHVEHDRAWRAYRDCLDLVLSEVETLLRAVDADDVLVTADHGNAFGEWGVYAHPYHLPLDVLREVPALRTTATAELDYEPALAGASPAEDASRDSEASIRERLAALGYARGRV